LIPNTSEVAPPSPEQALRALHYFFSTIRALTNPHTLLTFAGLALFWIVIATIGRAIILRQLDPRLRTPYVKLFFLNLARFILTAACFIAWVATTTYAFHRLIWLRLANGGDANVVLAFTLTVVSALLLFLLYCAISWLFYLAPIAVMQPAATKSSPALRSRLVEINLVMGIVRVCLTLLGMVFSACPLPFLTVETEKYLHFWLLGVFLLYVVASDFFHVVRLAAYQRLYEAFRFNK
ncbi:MAG: hypothetical protein ABI142_13030, partial [Bryocella sp.]